MLIERYGPDANMVALRLELAAGCPKIAAGKVMDLCGIERRARALPDQRAGAKRRTRPEASWNMPADRRVVVPSEPASPPQVTGRHGREPRPAAGARRLHGAPVFSRHDDRHPHHR
jgi:hypothetical protein